MLIKIRTKLFKLYKVKNFKLTILSSIIVFVSCNSEVKNENRSVVNKVEDTAREIKYVKINCPDEYCIELKQCYSGFKTFYYVFRIYYFNKMLDTMVINNKSTFIFLDDSIKFKNSDLKYKKVPPNETSSCHYYFEPKHDGSFNSILFENQITNSKNIKIKLTYFTKASKKTKTVKMNILKSNKFRIVNHSDALKVD